MVKALAFTHIWIALGAASAAAATLLAQGSAWGDWDALARSGIAGIAVATGCVYTWQRRVKLHKHPTGVPVARRTFLRRAENAMALVWGVLALAWLAGSHALWPRLYAVAISHPFALGGMAILALGYASNPLTGGRGWRDVPHLKWPVIAAAWGLVTGWLPLQFLPHAAGMNGWTVAASVATQTVFVAGLTLPFDVRDLPIDPVALRTVPQQTGIQSTSALALALVALSSLGFVFLDPHLGRACAGLAAAGGIVVAARVRREWVFSLWLDGCLILQGVLAFLMA